jgi:hypothetical protein
MTDILKTSCVVEFGDAGASDWLPDGAAAPTLQRATVQLRISQNVDGFFLCGESDNPNYGSGDTCHETVADAMAQAEFQLGVSRDRWQRIAA